MVPKIIDYNKGAESKGLDYIATRNCYIYIYIYVYCRASSSTYTDLFIGGFSIYSGVLDSNGEYGSCTALYFVKAGTKVNVAFDKQIYEGGIYELKSYY